MKKICFIAFLAMFTPCLVWAQFSISGKVTSLSGQALEKATVQLANTTIAVQTGASGSFTITNLKKGVYRIKVSHTGYRSNEQTVFADGDVSLNFKLYPGSIVTDEVIVRSTRAGANSATTYRNLSREEIQKNNQGQDLPYLLNQTPSAVVTSDAGAGVGYTGIRIRGSDPTRINVTINGIPYNDAESQGSYFVDVPDIVSSVDNIQIQRGVGTSTNGAGAFGASINIQTTTRRDTAYAELNNTYGSYNTWKNTVNVGTGLINGKFTFDGRLSRIKSDGYIDRASSNLKSYFLSGAYYGKNTLVRANVFSGAEKTYQAWNGVPEDILLAGNRTYNDFTYPNQTDNYKQNHYQLLYSHIFSPKVSINGALHYTKGSGYYEEYKDEQPFSKYNLEPIVIGPETIDTTNLVRRLWLDNDFYGLTWSLDYNPQNNLNFTLGGAYNEYDGRHFGEITWAQYTSNADISQQPYYYYRDTANKKDFNVYGKASYQLGKMSFNADLQYRRVDYSFLGYDRNLNNVRQEADLNFFNPKVGISYQLNNSSTIYASFAVANREPNRDDYTESTPESRPKPENLKDFEAGYRINQTAFSAAINGFYMLYDNQLVLTGQLNDVGEATRKNVKDSYRAGLEFDGQWRITKAFHWNATAALSSNKVKNYHEFLTIYDDDYNPVGQKENVYKKTDIAFSPDFVASSSLSYQFIPDAEIAFISKYVSKQYLDNTSNETRKLDPYFVNDVALRYALHLKSIKNIGFTFRVNNVFSELYESNGATYPEIDGETVYNYNYYYPQASRNFLLSVNVDF